MNGPGERLEMLQGSFCTTIYRLERRGWIKGAWGESENNRRARFYSLTAAGTRQLKAETAKWTGHGRRGRGRSRQEGG